VKSQEGHDLTWGPRYTAVETPTGLHRIVRVGGSVTVPAEVLPPKRRNRGLRLRAEAALTLRGKDAQAAYNALWAPLSRFTRTPRAAAQQARAQRQAEAMGPAEDVPDGLSLRQLRASLEWTQRDLAAYSGLSRGVIAECEALTPRRANVEARRTLRYVLLRHGAKA
jgi:hypothetical protein